MNHLAYQPWDPTGMTNEQIASTVRDRARELCKQIRERYGLTATVSDHWAGLATATICRDGERIAVVHGPDDQDWLLHEALKLARTVTRMEQ